MEITNITTFPISYSVQQMLNIKTKIDQLCRIEICALRQYNMYHLHLQKQKATEVLFVFTTAAIQIAGYFRKGNTHGWTEMSLLSIRPMELHAVGLYHFIYYHS
jgi:hypothetical protein